MCVCVLERAKHSFFALPNPLSCSVMNKTCLNQQHIREQSARERERERERENAENEMEEREMPKKE